MPDVPLERHEVEWVNQPCGEAGFFTTTGVGRSNQKADLPTMEERLAAFNKAKDQASFWATMFCATNPECPNARFVKYVNVKEDSVKGHLVLDLTIQWHCKKEESGNSIPTERA
ncbi:MAG: hypothetical protein IH857_03025 [Deltaproteobacteria bacterium]|nr:hypothetical protein [Deltaproteobacteria bacterium]